MWIQMFLFFISYYFLMKTAVWKIKLEVILERGESDFRLLCDLDAFRLKSARRKSLLSQRNEKKTKDCLFHTGINGCATSTNMQVCDHYQYFKNSIF